MFLNEFPHIPFPLICFILINLDFNSLQILQLPIIYGLLFLVILPLMLFDFVFLYKIDKKFPLHIIIHINSFFKKSLLSNKVKNFTK